MVAQRILPVSLCFFPHSSRPMSGHQNRRTTSEGCHGLLELLVWILAIHLNIVEPFLLYLGRECVLYLRVWWSKVSHNRIGHENMENMENRTASVSVKRGGKGRFGQLLT